MGRLHAARSLLAEVARELRERYRAAARRWHLRVNGFEPHDPASSSRWDDAFWEAAARKAALAGVDPLRLADSLADTYDGPALTPAALNSEESIKRYRAWEDGLPARAAAELESAAERLAAMEAQVEVAFAALAPEFRLELALRRAGCDSPLIRHLAALARGLAGLAESCREAALAEYAALPPVARRRAAELFPAASGLESQLPQPQRRS